MRFARETSLTKTGAKETFRIPRLAEMFVSDGPWWNTGPRTYPDMPDKRIKGFILQPQSSKGQQAIY